MPLRLITLTRSTKSREFISNAHLVGVGKSRDTHGDTSDITLKIGRHIDDGIGADRIPRVPVLREIEGAPGRKKDDKQRQKALHSSFLTVSRYLPYKVETSVNAAPRTMKVV